MAKGCPTECCLLICSGFYKKNIVIVGLLGRHCPVKARNLITLQGCYKPDLYVVVLYGGGLCLFS